MVLIGINIEGFQIIHLHDNTLSGAGGSTEIKVKKVQTIPSKTWRVGLRHPLHGLVELHVYRAQLQ